MGKKGSVRHLKRLASPAFWSLHRKEHVWVSKPSPGPHALEASLPLILLLREHLKLARWEFEAKDILAAGKVLIDGVPRRSVKYPVGLMDVVEVSGLAGAYRVLPTPGRRLALQHIPDEEKDFKLCRISGKTTLQKGIIQLHLHDGRNIVLEPREDAEVPQTFDTLKISLKDGAIMDHFKFEKGSYCLVTAGKNAGRHGTITDAGDGYQHRSPVVRLSSPDGNEYTSSIGYIFVVGREKPAIAISGGS